MLNISLLQGGRAGLLGIIVLGLFIQLAGLAFNNDGSTYATQLNLLLFLPSLLFLLLFDVERFEFESSTWILLLMFVWVMTCSIFHGADSVGSFFRNILYLTLYVSCLRWIIRSDRFFFKLLLVSSIVVAVIAWLTLCYQFSILNHPFEYHQARAHRIYKLGWREFADLGHPIYAGLYYGVFSIIITWFFLNFKTKLWQSGVLFFLIFGLLFYVLYTFSRGAWFSTCLSGFFLLLLFWDEYRSRALMIFGLLVLIVALFLFWPELINEKRIGVNGRQLIWAAWFERLPSFWLFGSGAGHKFDFTFPDGFRVNQAHSLYLQFWYEYGVVGIGLFVALLLSLLRKGWQCRDQSLAKLGLALLVFAMVAMVSEVHSIIMRPNPYWVVVWFPIGILLGLKPSKADSDKQLGAI